MRAAPPVLMACGPDFRWQAAMAVLAAAAGATLLGWLCAWTDAGSMVIAAATAAGAALAGVAAWRHLGRLPAGRLFWDGRTWLLDGAPGWIEPKLDLGDLALLHWRGEAGGRWLPLSFTRCGAPVHLARAALRAHAGPPDAWPAADPTDQRAPHG